MDLKEMFPMKLGFGGLRLPTSGSKDDVNYIRMCEMVDEYVANGGNYFDTSFIYHKGKSENAMAHVLLTVLKETVSVLLTNFRYGLSEAKPI